MCGNLWKLMKVIEKPDVSHKVVLQLENLQKEQQENPMPFLEKDSDSNSEGGDDSGGDDPGQKTD